jgi:hypothetical protein
MAHQREAFLNFPRIGSPPIADRSPSLPREFCVRAAADSDPSGGFFRARETPGRFKWEYTSGIADSIGGRGRKVDLAGM